MLGCSEKHFLKIFSKKNLKKTVAVGLPLNTPAVGLPLNMPAVGLPLNMPAVGLPLNMLALRATSRAVGEPLHATPIAVGEPLRATYLWSGRRTASCYLYSGGRTASCYVPLERWADRYVIDDNDLFPTTPLVWFGSCPCRAQLCPSRAQLCNQPIMHPKKRLLDLCFFCCQEFSRVM